MSDLDTQGFVRAAIQLTAEQCDHLALSIPSVTTGRGGVRGLISHPSVLQLLAHAQLGRYLWSVVGRDLVAVKATLFDKTVDENWRTQWHQDRVIAIRDRLNVAGYGPWTVKAGVTHVEPPAAVLEQMLAVRIFLDACGPENGPLRVVPGSHEWGKVADEELERRIASTECVDILGAKGTIMLMRPLLVHSSPAALRPGHRRVLHIELAPPEAISPLQWQTAIPLRRAA
jgi:ectoine hydroxylase-related dioxygenase (phytanoyl-CoA dioxygenase family)